MKKQLLAGSAIAAVALAWAAKDPVLMTVNGIDVPLSEFEYLYHKNSRQQLEPQPLSEYVEMFKLYKMKVADALTDRLDTLPSFKKEMEQYRQELATPYMTDSAYLYTFVDETFGWSSQEAEAKHIMKFKKPKDQASIVALMDSIKTAAANGASWTDLAAKYSDDKSSAQKDGSMGFITTMKFPYAFEKAVFTTPEGQVSEIIETPNTTHIIMGGKRRPARGKVTASHILKLVPEGSSKETEAAAKQFIDSIYAVVKADPASFGANARNNSDDKGSARQDGLLPAFGAGEMVPEFDNAAFALADGEISEPVRSRFGWHIIKRISGQPAPSRDEIKQTVLRQIQNPQDPRFRQILDHQTKTLAAKHNAKIAESSFKEMEDYIAANGIDSVFYERFNTGKAAQQPVLTIGKQAITRAELMQGMHNRPINDPKVAATQFDAYKAWFINNRLKDAEMNRLEKDEPDYRNLLNEYRDGSLLYEASVRKVWDKASKDTEGLEEYFNAHRSDYKWDKPHAKGYLVQALNDSVANEIKELMNNTPADSMVYKVRKAFSGKVQIDHVSAAKGENAMIDYLVFDGHKVRPRISNYSAMFMFNPRIIDQPEEAGDVRGQVTTDYQNLLQELWHEELKRKYPVKVNQKVLKKVK